MADQDSNYTPRSPDLSAFDQLAYPPDSWSAAAPPPLSDPNARQSYQPQYSMPAFNSSLPPEQPYSQQYPSYNQPAHLEHPYHQKPTFFPEQFDGMKDPGWVPDATKAPDAPDAPATKNRGVRQKNASAPSRPVVDVTRGIEVKTKFPVARIKRIMQADEDVGKVAQVTPVVVSKALEIFMISLVCKAAEEAKERGSKRVTAVHLKQAVVKDEQFDFLQEKVSKVPDAPAPVEKDEDGDDGGERKRKKRVARKKTTDSDEG